MKRWFARVGFVVLLQVLCGCMGARHAWAPQPVATPQVRIDPQEIYRQKNRLWVRVTFTNLTSNMLIVNRDAVYLQLDTGQILGRSSGSTTRHEPYAVAAHSSHRVWVDFKDRAIIDSTSARILWKDAVRDVAGHAIHIPPMQVTALWR